MTDYLRKNFAKLLNSTAVFFVDLGCTPNLMTVIGVIGNIIGAAFIAKGNLLVGGLFALIFGLFDAVDGSMARLIGGGTKYGAFLDSISDRISELVILFGLLVYFIGRAQSVNCYLVFVAASGSVLVSYSRARAQSLGVDTKTGILTRVERYLVMVISLLVQRPDLGLWVIAILSNLTVFQRIWDVRKKLSTLE